MLLYIPASSVSAICGRHKYRNRDEELINVLARYNKQIYDDLLTIQMEEETIDRPNTQMIEENFADNPEVKALISSSMYQSLAFFDKIDELKKVNAVSQFLNECDEENVELTHDLVETKTETSAKLCEKLIDSESAEVKELLTNICDAKIVAPNQQQELEKLPEVVQHKVTMDRGTKQENNAFKLYKEKQTEYNNAESCTTHLSKIINSLKIGGRVDGFILNEKSDRIGVLEIKTRKNGVFSKNKLNDMSYDLDQLSVYWFLTNFQKYDLVQYFDNKITIDSFTNLEMQARWNELAEQLENVQSKVQNWLDKKCVRDLCAVLTKYTDRDIF